MVFFLLSSLLPLLILIYITFQYVLPNLTPDQIGALRGWFTGGVLVMLVFPLMGFMIMSRWMVSLENLTKEVTMKSSEIMEGQKESRDENEIASLKHIFSRLYHEFQGKMSQLDEYSEKLIEANQKLSGLSLTDELTSLYNRRCFDIRTRDEMSRADRYGHELSVIMIDVDDFKRYNDAFGHHTGDKLLQDIARLIRKNTRESDVAFRYGGDEFAVLLPNASLKMAENTANRLVSATSSHQFEDKEKRSLGKITISCGVACYSEHSQDLVKAADSLMLKAKNEGKDRVVRAAEI